MKNKLKNIVTTALFSAMILLAVSCQKKEVKKVIVDNQFALALFSDTISLQSIINDMDSTTQHWLRVKDDVLYAYYCDTIHDVLKASDLLDDIEDVNFNTVTDFTLPPIIGASAGDTVLVSDRFMTIPFDYEGFEISSVLLRRGDLSFDFSVSPEIPMLKRIEVISEQLLDENLNPLSISIDYYDKGSQNVDLSGYTVIPDTAQSVAFSSRVTLHYDPSMGFEGGNYTCSLDGRLTNVKFNTVYGTVTTPLDQVYDDQTEIDYGINGLSGSAMLPVPTINLTYRNTFGFGAIGDVTKLEFVNTRTGLVTNLLAAYVVEVTVHPTEGEWQSTEIIGFTDEIDALAGYTRLDFGGEVTMDLSSGGISVSDTSTVDIVAEIEMPFTFDINDLRYNDTINVNFAGDIADHKIDDYFEEIDFFIDYNSNIKLNVTLQAEFLKNGVQIETLFDDDQTIYYDESHTGDIRTIPCVVTGEKLKRVMRANQMVLKLGVSTPGSGSATMMSTDDIFLRMRILTKTNEFDIDDVL